MSNENTETEQNFRVQTTVNELTKTGAIDAAKILIRQALLEGSINEYYDETYQDHSRIRSAALGDEKVHYSIHLMKSFLKALGCERTWETFLLEMDLEDDSNEYQHHQHHHWLTTEVKPLKKEYDIISGRLPDDKQTPEPYVFQDQGEYGALYSFVTDAWQTKQELTNHVVQQQSKQVEGASVDQVESLMSFMKKNKEMVQNMPTPSPAVGNNNNNNMHFGPNQATNITAQSTTPAPPQRRPSSAALGLSTSRPGSGHRSGSPASRPLKPTGGMSIVEPGNGINFEQNTNGGIGSGKSQVGTSFMLPGSVSTPQLRTGSRPGSPAKGGIFGGILKQ